MVLSADLQAVMYFPYPLQPNFQNGQTRSMELLEIAGNTDLREPFYTSHGVIRVPKGATRLEIVIEDDELPCFLHIELFATRDRQLILASPFDSHPFKSEYDYRADQFTRKIVINQPKPGDYHFAPWVTSILYQPDCPQAYRVRAEYFADGATIPVTTGGSTIVTNPPGYPYGFAKQIANGLDVNAVATSNVFVQRTISRTFTVGDSLPRGSRVNVLVDYEVSSESDSGISKVEISGPGLSFKKQVQGMNFDLGTESLCLIAGAVYEMAAEGEIQDDNFSDADAIISISVTGLCATPAANAVSIPSNASATSELGSQGRLAANVTDGKLRADGTLEATGGVWQSAGLGFSQVNDYSPSITLELGEYYLLKGVKIWNFPEEPVAVRKVRIETSSDGQQFQVLGEAPEIDHSAATATDIPFGGPVARFVRLAILENWGGTVYPLQPGAAPGGFHGFAGLSEVAVYGLPVANLRLPEITEQPASSTIASGGTAQFEAAADGDPLPLFQWQGSTDGGASWMNLTNDHRFGGTGSTLLTIKDVSVATHNQLFRFSARNELGETFSNPAKLTVTNESGHLPEGLLAFYPFNGNAQDSAGARHGIVEGDATLGTDRYGQANSAYNVTGQSGYIRVENLDPDNYAEGISFGTWVKVETQGGASLAWLHDAGWGSSFILLGDHGDGHIHFRFGSGNPSSDHVVEVPSFQRGKWHHVFVTHGTETDRLYVDGVLVDDWPAHPLLGNESTLRIGYLTGNWSAAIDEVAVFGRELSSNDVSAIYNGALTAIAPTITAQPNSLSVTEGEDASFNAIANGTPEPTLQWQHSVDAGANWTDLAESNGISGVTSQKITISGTTLEMNGLKFRVVATNVGGSVKSAAVTLTVNPRTVAPNIIAEPVNVTVTAGQEAIFTATATGTPMPTVNWQRSTDAGATWNELVDGDGTTGTTTSRLRITGTKLEMDGDLFRLEAVNIAGTVRSAFAKLTVKPVYVAPLITVPPGNVSAAEAQTAMFTAAASGVPTPSLQWQRSTNSGETWEDVSEGSEITGTTSGTLTIRNVSLSQNGHRFRLKASNSEGEAVSSAAILTLTDRDTLREKLLVFLPFNGNVADASGNARDAVIEGATLASDRFGRANGAFRVSGQSGRLRVDNVDPDDYAEGFSFGGWLKIERGSGSMFYWNADGDWSSSYIQFLGLVHFRFGTGSPSTDYPVAGTEPFASANGKWRHIFVTHGPEFDRLYLDGAFFQEWPAHPLRGNQSTVRIGGYEASWSWSAVVDEIAVFGRELSRSEVGQIHRGALSPGQPHLPRKIDGVTAEATSELHQERWRRVAAHAVDGIYCDSRLWESAGVGFRIDNEIDDRDPAITFDLQNSRTLNHLLIWNSHEDEPAIKRMMVELSDDGTTYRPFREVTLDKANGCPPVPQHISLDGVSGRFVRFDILENHGNQLFPIEGAATGNSFVAIDEVEFYEPDEPGIRMAPPIRMGNGWRFPFTGAPGGLVELERAANPSGPWERIDNATVTGAGELHDRSVLPGLAAFYRLATK